MGRLNTCSDHLQSLHSLFHTVSTLLVGFPPSACVANMHHLLIFPSSLMFWHGQIGCPRPRRAASFRTPSVVDAKTTISEKENEARAYLDRNGKSWTDSRLKPRGKSGRLGPDDALSYQSPCFGFEILIGHPKDSGRKRKYSAVRKRDFPRFYFRETFL